MGLVALYLCVHFGASVKTSKCLMPVLSFLEFYFII